jgi:hypothetical protein
MFNLLHTEAQQAQRQKYIDFCNAWNALTQEEKESYRNHPLANEKNLPPRQTFMSLFMRGKL